jgi:hypothetical protein
MKMFAALTALTLITPAAFAINPCHSRSLKHYTCNIVDARNQTSAQIEIDRGITTGGNRPFCTTGVVQESILGTVQFQTKAGLAKSDLLLPVGKNGSPVSDLEGGEAIATSFYSGGLMLDNLAAQIVVTPGNSGLEANLKLSGDINSIFTPAGKESVQLEASGACVEK